MAEPIVNPAEMPLPAVTVLADIETTLITYDSGGCMIIPDTVWMLVANDYERDMTYVWVGHDEVERGVRWLETCGHVIFHFGRGFDERVLRKHYNYKTPKSTDSVVLLRMLYSNQTEEDKIHVRQRKDRKEPNTRFSFTGDLVGKHTLEAWGLRLDPPCPKGAYVAECKARGVEPFMQYDQEMHVYALQDVKVLRRIWTEKILAKLTEKNQDLSPAIRVEHYMADLMEKVKTTGIKFNKTAAKKLVDELEVAVEKTVVQLKQDFPPRLEPVKWVFVPIEPNNIRVQGELEPSEPTEDVLDFLADAESMGELDTVWDSVNQENDEESDEENAIEPSKFKKTTEPHALTTLQKRFASNKVYRPYFTMPEGYQREMWGEITCSQVNRVLKDKEGNVVINILKYTGTKPVFKINTVKKGPNKGKETKGKMLSPESDGTGIDGDNAFVKCHAMEFNPRSRPQLVRRLLEMGWKPDEFTEAGNPVTDEPTLQKIEENFGHIHGAKNLAHYLMIEKRLGMIKSGKKAWLKLVDDNNFIHPTIIPCAAVTMRATHSDPNVSQVPAVKMVKDPDDPKKLIIGKGEAGKWNWDCRSLFTVPDEFCMIGVDLEGIELRCWGHYQWPYDDGALADQILNEDIHENNRKILGFNDRTTAKRWLFAMLYGGGDEQLRWIIAPTANVIDQINRGRESKRRFMSGVRGFDQMKRNLEMSVKRRGWLRGIDGRRVPIRKPHAALNTQLQSCGAIISKYWIRNTINNLTEAGLTWSRNGYAESDYTLMLYSHDEIQLAVRDRFAQIVADAATKAAEQAGVMMGMRLPIAAKATFKFPDGTLMRHWGDTH